jgi:hypothetical protein
MTVSDGIRVTKLVEIEQNTHKRVLNEILGVDRIAGQLDRPTHQRRAL